MEFYYQNFGNKTSLEEILKIYLSITKGNDAYDAIRLRCLNMYLFNKSITKDKLTVDQLIHLLKSNQDNTKTDKNMININNQANQDYLINKVVENKPVDNNSNSNKTDNINTTRKFDLNIEKVLVDWEVYHGIREIIANALDEQILTDIKDISIFFSSDGKLHIRDYGRGLQYKHLTQNENVEKIKNDKLIGKFGVGLKDALATFDRHNINVYIKSKYGDITFGKSEKIGFNDILTLHAFISEPTDEYFVGTDFILDGCTEYDLDIAKSLFLKFNSEKVVEKTIYGSVLERTKEYANIYINGLKVASEDNFLFSYNITSITKAIKKELNRERTNIGRSAYSDRVKSILLNCKSEEVAKKISNDMENSQNTKIHDELQWKDIFIHACKILNAKKEVVFVSTHDFVNNSSTIQDIVNFSNRQVIHIPDYIEKEVSGQKYIEGNIICDVQKVITDANKKIEYMFIKFEELSESEQEVFNKTKEVINIIEIMPKFVKQIKISENMIKGVFDYGEVVVHGIQ